MKTVRVFHGDAPLDIPEGTSCYEIVFSPNFNEQNGALGIIVNGEISDWGRKLKDGDSISLLHFQSTEGRKIFWHTSAHLLAQAVLKIWPTAIPTIGPSTDGGFYYDFANLKITEKDLDQIEKEMLKIADRNVDPIKQFFLDKDGAVQKFKNNKFKIEIIKEIDGHISVYEQSGFFDLCKGPHLPQLSQIKAIKLTKISGAYWRGDPNGSKLTRIYGMSYPNQKLLESRLVEIEEAKQRDHRHIGASMDLFSFMPEAPAIPFFHPKGVNLFENLLSFWRELHLQHGYETIKTPQLMTDHVWKTSGHWDHYKEHMFLVHINETNSYAIKPMSCPGCMLYFKKKSHSYRELPIKIAECGHVHRKEPSGALNGLFRVQSFHQDDAHIFMREDQIVEEIFSLMELVKYTYNAFGLDYFFELSTRPKKSIGTDISWDTSTNSLEKALKMANVNFAINPEGGAFYGPKIDLHVTDAIGRRWQCGTIQLDFSLPEKFNLKYKDSGGTFKTPIVIHRAIFGSMERFIAILIEHFNGWFPLWISPMPFTIIPISDRHLHKAIEIMQMVKKNGFYCELKYPSGSLGKHIRDSHKARVNYQIIIGDQEVNSETISVRTRKNHLHKKLNAQTFLNNIMAERESRLASSFLD